MFQLPRIPDQTSETLKASAPIRLVQRHYSELLINRSSRWLATKRVDVRSGFMFDVILDASMAHHPYRRKDDGRWIGLLDIPAMGRPVTSVAIAQSMNLPHTTVRRRTAGLVEGGWLNRSAAGYTIGDPYFDDAPVLEAICATNARDLFTRLPTLAEGGVASAARAMDADLHAIPPPVVERMILNFALRVLQPFTRHFGDIIAGRLYSLIVGANVGAVTADDTLGRLYADTPPPDELREPITIRELARLADLPFETVRRRVKSLIENGMVEPKGDGLIVPRRVVASDWNAQSSHANLIHFEHMLNQMIGLAAPGP